MVKKDRLRDASTHESQPIVCCSRTESRTHSLNFSRWETEINRFLGEKTNGLSEGAIYNSHCPSVAWTYLKDTLYIFMIQNSSQPFVSLILQGITYNCVFWLQFNAFSTMYQLSFWRLNRQFDWNYLVGVHISGINGHGIIKGYANIDILYMI